ncbi:hypothetical protein NQ317_014524 [Molorchus minor]|uniref:Uncharacterized protein n=1 Tax=Molorchus minor TaxID=1323400 RepID=A0ABQ9JAL7_9CUCU|nr:hypothetical protein NQ317_014524 [Molorchus minor]
MRQSGFGGDLVKISEGFAYEPVAIIDQKYQEENENPVTETNSDDAKTEETENPIVLQPLLIRDTIKHNVKKLELQENYKKLVNNGTIHEICCFCALLCFSISLLAMVNILAEYEYARRGLVNISIFFVVK